MKKSYYLGVAVLGVIITTAIVAGSTYAFGNGWGMGGHSLRLGFGGQGNNLKIAIENNDYSVLGENPKITEEQFGQMIEVHNLMQEGKFKEAKGMRKDLGFNRRGFGQRAGMFKREKFDPERQEAINAALEAGDYNAWLEAVGEDCPLTQRINEENFSRLVEAHNLMGQARAIFEELGIERGVGWRK